jgi:F-type H+-transporting ATPase subunit b
MEATLKQLGELLLGAVPTIIFLLLLFGLYKTLIYKPLGRVLEERYRKTEGAFDQAKADIQAAEMRTAEYEQRLRDARIAVFRSQEERRTLAMQARSAAAGEARAAADRRVTEARAALAQQVETARSGLMAESERLAREVIRAVLSRAEMAQSPAGLK